MTTEIAALSTSFTAGHGLDTGPISVLGCTSQEYYQREIENIWKRTWLEVGRLHTVLKPGDFFVKDLPGVGASVLVVRDRQGELRAFHNVCTHRCNKLVWDDRGNSRRITCHYHGWMFGLDGKLAGVTDSRNFFDLDKSTLGLVPIALETWEDFVFINLDPTPQETLREFLGSLYDGFRGYAFHEYTQVYSWGAELNCNWKIARDAFVESYHAPYLHRRTFAKSFMSQDDPNIHSIGFSVEKYHVQNSLPSNTEYVPPPMELMAFTMGGSGLMDRGGRDIAVPKAVNPLRSENWSSDITHIFPSMVFVCFPNLLLHFNLRPLAVDRCRFEVRQAMRPPRTASERWAQEVANVTFHTGVLEDFMTCETSQAAMGSGAVRQMQLQDNEFAVRYAHKVNQQFAGPYPSV